MKYNFKVMIIMKKTILITGSTSGIGKATALKLVESGEEVIIHGRNQEKAMATVEEIKQEVKNAKIHAVYGDIRFLKDIKSLVEQVKERIDKLDILINNAGVFKPKRTITGDGLEETFAVNYVAPFIITNELIDLLKRAPSARIINVASEVHSNHPDFDDLQHEKDYSGTKAYSLSKTCLIMFTYLLAEKLKGTDITVNTLHPGVINTKLLDLAYGHVGVSTDIGAKNLIYLATSPDLEGITGNYFNNSRMSTSKSITYDKDLQRKLWKKTETLIGKKFTYELIPQQI